MLEAIIAPEELAARDHGRDPEHAPRERVIGGEAQGALDLRVGERRAELIGVDARAVPGLQHDGGLCEVGALAECHAHRGERERLEQVPRVGGDHRPRHG